MDLKQLMPLLLLFLTVILPVTICGGDDTVGWVSPTLVQSDAGAVCLTEKPASYYFVPGHDKGIHNWLVYLSGGGWCDNPSFCLQYANGRNITKDPAPYYFDYILSSNKVKNPDFFEWNRVVVNYCDGGSFMGDSETVYNGTKLYFRGARIYKAVMQDLLLKGMKKAQNALLVGSSAGGVAATLHCDGFRELLPDANRVKCFSDAGYFFHSKRFKDEDNLFVTQFRGVVKLQGSIKSLPKTCTSRLSPYQCFFPQYVQEDIKTPIFFLMSAFDYVQATYTLIQNKTTISTCFLHKNCSKLRSELLSVLPRQSNTSRGILITSPTAHEQVQYPYWDLDMVVDGSNKTISELFRDWYFDKTSVRIIDKYPCPYKC